MKRPRIADTATMAIFQFGHRVLEVPLGAVVVTVEVPVVTTGIPVLSASTLLVSERLGSVHPLVPQHFSGHAYRTPSIS